jgi:fatty acid-binding protein DegV
MNHFPYVPGVWSHATGGTSQQAQKLVKASAPAVVKRVEAYIRDNGPASPEEITAAIQEAGERVLLTTVRARVCQLHKLGRVTDSGQRGLGESLRAKVIKWRIASDEELAMFAARKAAGAEHGARFDDGDGQ